MRGLSRTVDAKFSPVMALGARRVRSSARPARVAAAPPQVVYLSPEDRALLAQKDVHLSIGDRDVAQSTFRANRLSSRQGVG